MKRWNERKRRGMRGREQEKEQDEEEGEVIKDGREKVDYGQEAGGQEAGRQEGELQRRCIKKH